MIIKKEPIATRILTCSMSSFTSLKRVVPLLCHKHVLLLLLLVAVCLLPVGFCASIHQSKKISQLSALKLYSSQLTANS